MSTPTGCKCKSICSTKRKENATRGCPCKGRNTECSADCQCGTRAKPCQNKGTAANSERERDGRGRRTTNQGFRLTHQPNMSEDMLRGKEHKDVKVFIDTLDANMVRKLAIRSLRRGIGSMDYIGILLIKEDDLYVHVGEGMGELFDSDQVSGMESSQQDQQHSQPQSPDPAHIPPNATVPEWCKCGKCRPMPQEVENKCCKQKKCITLSSRFTKICLDPDVLELCIRNTSDIRNDKEDNSTKAFRKAAYRQFILARHGYLGKRNRRVCPSCVVLKIREQYPSITGVYMGYREH